VTSQFLAMLAAAGLVTAGVSATAETRSVSALPSITSVAGVAPARVAPQVDCTLTENIPLDVCKSAGKTGAAVGGSDAGTGGAVAGGAAAGGGGSILLPVLLGVLGVGGIAAGLAGSSKG